MVLIFALSSTTDPTLVLPNGVKQEILRDLPTIHPPSGATRQLYLEEVAHPFEFAILALLIHRALRSSTTTPSLAASPSTACVPSPAKTLRFPCIVPGVLSRGYSIRGLPWSGSILVRSLLVTAAYAILDELHQMFVPGRAFQWVDLILDLAGILMGLSLAHLWRRWKTPPVK